jgi:hypothetical protein
VQVIEVLNGREGVKKWLMKGPMTGGVQRRFLILQWV